MMVSGYFGGDGEDGDDGGDGGDGGDCHRPPFFDIVDDAHNEDGGGDKK